MTGAASGVVGNDAAPVFVRTVLRLRDSKNYVDPDRANPRHPISGGSSGHPVGGRTRRDRWPPWALLEIVSDPVNGWILSITYKQTSSGVREPKSLASQAVKALVSA